MTQYQLTRYALGRQPSIQLERSEYKSLLRARTIVLEGLALEELFDVMLGNYEEFERELLSTALSQAIYFDPGYDWSTSIGTLQLIARRLANVLTTTQAYCDQLPHLIGTLYGSGSSQVTTVQGYFRQAHSASFAYRACVELRRYAQHRGAAVHGFRGHSAWVERDGGGDVHIHSVAPEVSTNRLRDDSKFKRTILEELIRGGRASNLPGDVMYDVRPLVRGYVSALGKVHQRVRDLVIPELDAADAAIERSIERFMALPEASSSIGLAAVELSDSELLEGQPPYFISSNLIGRRRALVERNYAPTNFGTAAVTSEAPSLAE